MNTTSCPQTLIEAVRYFSDLDLCHSYMVGVKWPDGKITCPECGADNIGTIKARPAGIGSDGKKKRARQPTLQCKNVECRKQFSAKVGTIFEDSPLGLDKWFVAVWCITNAKNGISSCEVARAIGVTQKTAWFLLHRIRLAMQTGSFEKFKGEIESDETFIGGKAKFMHAAKREERIQGRGTVGKTIAQGILQRGGKVRVSVVPDQKKETLQRNVRRNVMPGAHVFTDTLRSYEGLSVQYVHGMVDHSAGQYVDGKIHTNGMENFWSLTKRCLKGTYVAVAPWHLFRYLDEESMRFNERWGNDAERFVTVLSRIAGRRLTYKALIGQA
jgi:transposase-like protein